MKVRIAHISDLHFGKLSFSLSYFFSKRWIGALNLLLNRRKHYLNSRPETLLPIFEKQEITHVFISGDVSTISHTKEFEMAQAFIRACEAKGMKVYIIPGNHDHYTKKSYQAKIFYDYFPEKYDEKSPFSLKTDGITTFDLTDDWVVILMDTALATAFYHSIGYFSKELEDKLIETLASIPDGKKAILVNHFPFFQHESPRRRLRRGGELQALLRKDDKVQIYLHGHTHRHTLADLRKNGLPLILDSGCTSQKYRGSWNMLEITSNQCLLMVFSFDKEENLLWKTIHQKLYSW